MPEARGFAVRAELDDDPPPPRALRTWTLDELRRRPDRDYILKGMMSPQELSVWWGPPKCGKSFLLMRIPRYRGH